MAWDEAVWAVDEVKGKIAQAGYPPKAMSMINVVDAGGGVVNLYFKPPANTYLRDQADGSVPLVTVGGVEIRKKAGTHITSRTDGERFMVIPASDMNNYTTTPIVDDDVEIGTTYCYRFFPFSTLGTYNENDTSEHAVEVTQEGHMLIYGFDQDFRDLNPDTQITYPSDCVNYEYEPLNMNENTGGPTAGGWEHFLVNVLRNAPFMVKRNGEADYELDHENYKLKIDGTDSDWNDPNYQGMPMAWLQTMYKKEWYTDGGEVRHVRYCEGVPINEDPADWIPIGYIPDINSVDHVRKGIWIPIGEHALNADYYGEITFNGIYNSLSYNLKKRTMYNPGSMYSICKCIKDFCPTTDIDSAFSAFYGDVLFKVIRDYLYMLVKTTNFGNVLHTTITSGFAAPEIDSDYTIVPGFSGKTDKHSKVFYSYLIHDNGTYRDLLLDITRCSGYIATQYINTWYNWGDGTKNSFSSRLRLTSVNWCIDNFYKLNNSVMNDSKFQDTPRYRLYTHQKSSYGNTGEVMVTVNNGGNPTSSPQIDTPFNIYGNATSDVYYGTLTNTGTTTYKYDKGFTSGNYKNLFNHIFKGVFGKNALYGSNTAFKMKSYTSGFRIGTTSIGTGFPAIGSVSSLYQPLSFTAKGITYYTNTAGNPYTWINSFYQANFSTYAFPTTKELTYEYPSKISNSKFTIYDNSVTATSSTGLATNVCDGNFIENIGLISYNSLPMVDVNTPQSGYGFQYEAYGTRGMFRFGAIDLSDLSSEDRILSPFYDAVYEMYYGNASNWYRNEYSAGFNYNERFVPSWAETDVFWNTSFKESQISTNESGVMISGVNKEAITKMFKEGNTYLSLGIMVFPSTTYSPYES